MGAFGAFANGCALALLVALGLWALGGMVVNLYDEWRSGRG